MTFKPMGGFPPIDLDDIESKNNFDNKTLETRGFSASIVNVGEIVKSKKKENLFSAFGPIDDEYD